jgi:ATP-dependent Zn protease
VLEVFVTGRPDLLVVVCAGRPRPGDWLCALRRLGYRTPGMVGADLANLANEAALLAARRQHERVERADFTDALEKILLGAPRGIVLSPIDRERTAYHEAGHALVGMLTPGADPVRKVSIIPRGMALGVTLSAPDDDQVSYTLEALLAKLRVAVAGRVAEELVYGTITTGAESDIQQLTAIARQMVGRWGMSETVGLVSVLPLDGRGALLPGASETSQATQQLVDDEVAAPGRRRPSPGDRGAWRAPCPARRAHPRAARGRDARRHRRLPCRPPADAAPRRESAARGLI